MLGSLTFYRRILHENVFTSPWIFSLSPLAVSRAEVRSKRDVKELPTLGHALAGVMAGWTVSVIAAPVEHIKARLQIQYAVDKNKRLYHGPIDCTRKIVRTGTSASEARYTCSMLTLCLVSTVPTGSAASTTVSRPHCFSDPFSSSGGDPTI